MSHPIHYRPHHFLCSLGFENKGYSDAFIANMASIVEGQLRAPSGEDKKLKITFQADDICAPCPKRRGTGCSEQAKIDTLDAAHAKALGLSEGDVITWGEALERIKSRITPPDLHRICKDCAWLEYGMCEAAVARLRDAEVQSPLDPRAPE
ncbi:MAG: DUF1284 domain-containing protein [Litoreibacter sp.]|uniref:DUF1284 domain-containing protein n=1 Tax=Litoreibacter sp. TaxID=1969459 RepID=UPI003298DC4F